MRRIFLSLLIILLAGCAPSAESRLEDYRMPTDVPSAASLTETTEAEIAGRTLPEDCPVTVPQDPPFTPPAPYDTLGFKGDFWFGSNSLWTAISRGGVWDGLPFEASSGYTEKIFWWRDGYVWNEEPQPDLTVTGERLDAQAPPLRVFPATNAYASDIGSAMLTGVEFPTAGCWKITGRYADSELSFVVWVAP